MKYLFYVVLLMTFSASCQSKKGILGKEFAEQQVKKAMADQSNLELKDTLVKNRKTAISIAESILFDIYGEDDIIKERPYECYLIDDFWYIGGTIPKNSEGGGFEIIISSKNAQIIKVTHYK